jgi:hypothetical protein
MTALSVTHLMFVFVVSSVWRNRCNPFSKINIFIYNYIYMWLLKWKKLSFLSAEKEWISIKLNSFIGMYEPLYFRVRKMWYSQKNGQLFSSFLIKVPTMVIMKDAVFCVVRRDSDVSDKRQANRSVCHLHLPFSCLACQKTVLFISTVSIFHVLLKLQNCRVLFAVPSRNANVEQIIYRVSSHGKWTRHNIYWFVEMDTCY